MSNRELDKLYEKFLNQYPSLDYDINKKATNINEIKGTLYQIENNVLIDLLANTIVAFNKEKEEKEKKYIKLKKYNFDKFMNLDKIITILKYMYYEYDVTTDDFINLCTKVLKEDVNKEFVKYLMDNDIIKLLDDNKVSLSTGGINLAVNLGLSLSDEDKDSYVYTIKKKINS
jgi:hypothetical protein